MNKDIMEHTIAIVGLVDNTIQLRVRNVHGDREMLAQDPEHTHLYIRKPATRRHRAPALHWRRVTSRATIPNPEKPTRTYYQGKVYPHLQHAFLACLLCHIGGEVQYEYRPHCFPMVHANGTKNLCPDVSDVSMGLHWIPNEPSHMQLVEYGQQLHHTQLRWCMLLVGSMQPVHSRWPAGRPQLRGILLDGNRFTSGDTSIPVDAMQTDWYPCLLPSLVFARHGAQDGKPLPPALLPPLSNMGLCLWNRNDHAYSIEGQTQQPETWNIAITEMDENPFPITAGE